MKALAAILCLSVLPGLASSTDATRDWTIERPFLSGYLHGLSLGVCSSCRLGAAGQAAGEHDPFAVTPVVREELRRLAARPYRTAQFLGAISTFFVIGGVFFRRVNTLKVMELAK